MTDRERLLEQVREAEERADSVWKWILRPQYRHSVEEVADIAARRARESAHHALTALALRDVLATTDAGDRVIFWINGDVAWERECR